MDIQELKFKFKEKFSQFKIVAFYFIQEPFYEAKRVWEGTYESTLFFWFTIIFYLWLWKRGIGGLQLKIAGFLIFFAYFYMFFKGGKWKEYYRKEFIEGKDIE